MTRPPRLVAAADWKGSAAELARKIVSVAGPRATIAFTVKNSSSLSEEDVVQVRRALRAEIRRQGVRLGTAGRAQATAQVTLSESFQNLVWIAETQRGESRAVAMVAVDRASFAEPVAKLTSLALWKKSLMELDAPILDLAELPPSSDGALRWLMLAPDQVSLWEWRDSSWQVLQSVPIAIGPQPWPRDLRGRLMPRPDQTIDAYRPGMKCSGTAQPALTLDCEPSEEMWPLAAGASGAFSATPRPGANYFEGPAQSGRGRESQFPSFYSAAIAAEESPVRHILAEQDGTARLYAQSVKAIATMQGWGSDIAGIETGCGAGWQVLVTRPGDSTVPDAIQAFEIVGRRAAAVSAPVEFAGPVTALWPAPDGRAAVAVSRHLETGRYEAFHLSVSCGH